MQRRRHLEVNLVVSDQSLVNLLQTWRAFDLFRNAERKTHCLVKFDVRILAYNDDFQILESSFRKRIKNQLFGWVAHLSRVFRLNIAEKLGE